jgi:putative ABC transport system substrate-binding protein
VFASLVQKRIHALWVDGVLLFATRRLQLATLAAYHHVPATYAVREHVEAGGLMSYGPDLLDQ